jgi:hypothetical protein
MSEARVRVAAFLATLGEKRSRDVASLEHMAKAVYARARATWLANANADVEAE